MRKLIIVLASCLCISLVACHRPQEMPRPQDPPQPVDAFLACVDNARMAVGDYILFNNVWNKGQRTDYTQCVFAQSELHPAVIGWRWEWPGTGRQIKAYPEVMVGDSPWDKASATGDLPVPVTNRDLFVTYAASVQATGSYNVALEMWLTSALPPAEENITDEIMIWVDAHELTPGPPTYDILTIDDATYSLHIRSRHGDASGESATQWSYIAFYSRAAQHAATLNIGTFLGYLLEQGIIQEDRYVASIEMGTEIASGKGEFVLSTYEVTVP